MPNFKKMTDYDADGMGMKDPYGMSDLKKVLNPFKEAKSSFEDSIKTNLPTALQSTLHKMSIKLQLDHRQPNKLLSEEISNQALIIEENELLNIDED